VAARRRPSRSSVFGVSGSWAADSVLWRPGPISSGLAPGGGPTTDIGGTDSRRRVKVALCSMAAVGRGDWWCRRPPAELGSSDAALLPWTPAAGGLACGFGLVQRSDGKVGPQVTLGNSGNEVHAGGGGLGESLALLRADDGDASGRRVLPWKRPSICSLPLRGTFFLGVKSWPSG
jgi:hypothetical protein